MISNGKGVFAIQKLNGSSVSNLNSIPFLEVYARPLSLDFAPLRHLKFEPPHY